MLARQLHEKRVVGALVEDSDSRCTQVWPDRPGPGRKQRTQGNGPPPKLV